jgi:cytochrome c553
MRSAALFDQEQQLQQSFLSIFLAVSLPLTFFGHIAEAAKSDSCAHCHGTDGNSSSSAFPSLAGQTKEYLLRQMKDFKEERRKNVMMSPSIRILGEEDMQELADYFSAQTLVRGSFKPDPALVTQGKAIADERQCMTCHQPGFKGMNEFPRLSRQKVPYLVKQLKDFRDGARNNDNGIMTPTTKDLSDEQIQALAHYLASF